MTLMREGLVVDLTAELAEEASKQAATNKLTLADSIIYATALRYGAVLWTTDAHFKGLAGVQYLEKT